MKIKLNLIPPYRKEEIKKAGQLRLMLKWVLELTAILSIFLVLLFSMDYILQLNLSSANNNIGGVGKNSGQVKEIERYDTEVRGINAMIAEIEKIQSGQLKWENFFKKLNEDVLVDIKIDSISTKDFKILLSGKAKNRDVLIAFKDGLEKDGCFSNINLPLSNLVIKEDVSFQIDFNIKKECLKK